MPKKKDANSQPTEVQDEGASVAEGEPLDESSRAVQDVPSENSTAAEGEAEDASETSAREEELARRLADAEGEIQALREKHLRLAAEYDNYRKRTNKERGRLRTDAIVETVACFLPVYDNLERALSQHTEDAAYRKGVELIQTGLLETLAKLRVLPIEAMGQPFDPERHDAVAHSSDDSDEKNVVAEVFRAGFILDGQVVRHAVVKVKN